MKKNNLSVKPIIFGVLGGLALLSVYFMVLIIANSAEHAIEQLIEIKYWIFLLVVGFGIQVGLYMYVKGYSNSIDKSATSAVAAAGGVSTTSMVACCAHHLTDILPIIGFSAAALFLSKYQVLFMIIGVLSNIIGINMMLRVIQNHKLYRKGEGVLESFMHIDFGKAMRYNVFLSILIVLMTFFLMA